MKDFHQRKVITFYEQLAAGILEGMKIEQDILVVLSNNCHNLRSPDMGHLTYLIETSYLKHSSFRDSYMLAHELGHIVSYMFIQENLESRFYSRILDRLMLMPLSRDKFDKHFETVLLKWIPELVADRIACIVTGPVVPVLWYDEFSRRYDWNIGSNTHPPPSLRYILMVAWVSSIKDTDTQFPHFLDKMVVDIDPMEFSLRRFTGLSKDALYDRALVTEMLRTVEEIVVWLNPPMDIKGIVESRNALLNQKRPKTLAGGFAAYLELEGETFDPLQW